MPRKGQQRPVDMTTRVWNKPFRDALLGNPELSTRMCCEALGWMREPRGARGRKDADASRLRRALGIIEDSRCAGKHQHRTTISYDEALALLPVFPNLDPVDVGV